ncbi:hypothetical protein CWR48_13940 [Oceanobacillus arenosus]|uniref:DUF1642 domain-containing protein n=1 Tax=Oceanobacillus arenosus TaxID=1229153 RepID=A0A3D8PND1_9BACI|nr:hypothetical protein [Oceanobacillus arenosus]RDW17613.1 hypothetical protein CWR48_13940 [Oceanobacillus arenosus]
MKKVKVRASQAQMIENHRNAFETLMLKRMDENCGTVLDDVRVYDVARAFFIGYEVEPEFKVGDWVVYEQGNVGQYGDKPIVLKNPVVRHATPEEIAQEKERRWWKLHGREVWELKQGDILRRPEDEHTMVVTSVGRAEDMTVVNYEGDDYVYFCDVKKEYKVSSFAENRLDVNPNE